MATDPLTTGTGPAPVTRCQTRPAVGSRPGTGPVGTAGPDPVGPLPEDRVTGAGSAGSDRVTMTGTGRLTRCLSAGGTGVPGRRVHDRVTGISTGTGSTDPQVKDRYRCPGQGDPVPPRTRSPRAEVTIVGTGSRTGTGPASGPVPVGVEATETRSPMIVSGGGSAPAGLAHRVHLARFAGPVTRSAEGISYSPVTTGGGWA